MSILNKFFLVLLIINISISFAACNNTSEDDIIPIENVKADKAKSNDANGEINKENNSEKSSENSFDENSKDTIVVYVCGAVKKPGVCEISCESRVIDAVNAARGVTSDAAVEYVNLASLVKDGQKIYIPSYDELESSENINDSAMVYNNDILIGEMRDDKGAQSGLININTADEATLTTIPGIGKSKAEKIINYRNDNGDFNCIEDIMLIQGIKEGMFNKIKDYICVE